MLGSSKIGSWPRTWGSKLSLVDCSHSVFSSNSRSSGELESSVVRDLCKCPRARQGCQTARSRNRLSQQGHLLINNTTFLGEYAGYINNHIQYSWAFKYPRKASVYYLIDSSPSHPPSFTTASQYPSVLVFVLHPGGYQRQRNRLLCHARHGNSPADLFSS